jgi:hypothetical protein
MLTLSFIAPSMLLQNPGRLALPADFPTAPSRAERQATDLAVAALVEARAELGTLLVNESVAALAPFAFAKEEIQHFADDVSPDTVAYLPRGYDAEALEAQAQAMRFKYTAPGTNLRVASNRDLSESAIGRKLRVVRLMRIVDEPDEKP